MISVNLSASCGATRCHITCVSEKPCSNSSGGPLPPTRAKMRPDLVLIHSEEKPGNRSARSGMVCAPSAAKREIVRSRSQAMVRASNFVCRCRWLVADICHPASPIIKNHNEETAMSIDFEIPAEAKAIREKVRQWVHDECIPAGKGTGHQAARRSAGEAARRRPARRACGARSCRRNMAAWASARWPTPWCRWSSAKATLGALSMNTQGPDDATMLTILAHGTEYQKEKFLKPLLNGEKRICYSMTEKAAGADATGMRTTAVKDGNENYVLNGEKWFSSSASAADMALVMARTDPNAPRHQQYSTFIVELPNPGYKIKRNIPTMAIEGPLTTSWPAATPRSRSRT